MDPILNVLTFKTITQNIFICRIISRNGFHGIDSIPDCDARIENTMPLVQIQ